MWLTWSAGFNMIYWYYSAEAKLFGAPCRDRLSRAHPTQQGRCAVVVQTFERTGVDVFVDSGDECRNLVGVVWRRKVDEADGLRPIRQAWYQPQTAADQIIRLVVSTEILTASQLFPATAIRWQSLFTAVNEADRPPNARFVLMRADSKLQYLYVFCKTV